MGLLSSLVRLIKKIFSFFLKLLKDILGKYWMIILLVVAIWFAPVIAGWLSSIGAPSFLVEAMTWVGTNLTIPMTEFLKWAWSGVSQLGTTAWTAFKDAQMGTQVALVTGAAAAIAPEETAAVIADATEAVIDVGTGVIGAVASGLASNPAVLIGGGLLLWWMLSSRKSTVVIDQGKELNGPTSVNPA